MSARIGWFTLLLGLVTAAVGTGPAVCQAEDLLASTVVAILDDSLPVMMDDGDEYALDCVCDGHAHSVKHGRVDTHAPAHLFGEHVHKRGDWMVEYKYQSMYMAGNRSGTTQLTDTEALNFTGVMPPNGYLFTPTDMTMEMHMLHVMYGLTDDVTLFVMPMWMVNVMDHIRRPGSPPAIALGSTFRTVNSGFGDLRFGALWRVYDGETDELIFNLGVSAPTGDIDRLTTQPAGMPVEYPYPMRLGAGTWNARPGVSYRRYWEKWSLGLQFQTDLPMGLNDSRYRLGNTYQANAWVSRVLDRDKNWAATFRVEGLWRSNFVGADPQLNPGLISTADPDMRGGEFLNFGYGLMYKAPLGGRLNFEIAQRVYQRLRGVQLETDWSLAASYSKAF